MIGEYRKNRDGGLSISPTAVKIFKTRMVDSGEEAKYLDVIQQVTMSVYEQPCQLYNRTVRFGIYWEWYQVTVRDIILTSHLKNWCMLQIQNKICKNDSMIKCTSLKYSMLLSSLY